MAGSPKKRARKLLAASAKLDDAFEAEPLPTDVIPTRDAPQALVDARAATAFVYSPQQRNGDRLNDLYPEASSLTKTRRQALHDKTFANDRVRAILRNDLSDLESQRRALLHHMVSIALDRSNPDLAIRAFSQLSKVAGWAAPIKVETTGKTFNIHTLLQDGNAIREALAQMDHEPGAAIAVDSDARDDWERRHGTTLDAE